MVHSVSGWTRGVQVILWDPLRTRAIPECLRGVFTTRRYTNTRLPYLTTTAAPLMQYRCGLLVNWYQLRGVTRTGHAPNRQLSEFFLPKMATVTLFSLPEVFCGPQICQKCVGGRGPRWESSLFVSGVLQYPNFTRPRVHLQNILVLYARHQYWSTHCSPFHPICLHIGRIHRTLPRREYIWTSCDIWSNWTHIALCLNTNTIQDFTSQHNCCSGPDLTGGRRPGAK